MNGKSVATRQKITLWLRFALIKGQFVRPDLGRRLRPRITPASGLHKKQARAARDGHRRWHLFNGCRRYFVKATAPCVVAYGYARIRRLVRLGVGFYRLSVAEKNSDRVW